MQQKARVTRHASRVFWCAFLNAICYLLILGVAASAVVIVVDRHLTYAAFFIGSLVAFIILRTLAHILGAKLSCQLCHGATFRHRHCQMHKNSRKYLWLSHRASMILDIVLRTRYFCMYCGTRYRLRR